MNDQQKKYRLGTVSKKIYSGGGGGGGGGGLYPVSRHQPRHWFLKTDLMKKATKKIF